MGIQLIYMHMIYAGALEPTEQVPLPLLFMGLLISLALIIPGSIFILRQIPKPKKEENQETGI